MRYIDGYKTYIVAGIMFTYALVGMYVGFLTVSDGINLILASASLIGVGHKIDKSIQSKKEQP